MASGVAGAMLDRAASFLSSWSGSTHGTQPSPKYPGSPASEPVAETIRSNTTRTMGSGSRPASRTSTWSRVISTLTRRSPKPKIKHDELAKAALHFQDPTLLRSTTSNILLGSFGRLLREDYHADHDKLSKVDTSLDCFVSHNWSTNRWNKYLVLVMHFNLPPAVISWLAWVVVCFIVQVNGHGPRQFVMVKGELVPYGFLCGFGGSVVFLLAFFSWHEVSSWFGFNGATVFFDKACVHQSDRKLKSQGIKHLAAFIFYSWNMLVCYSDVYLKKLWTIYEVTTFLIVHPGSVADIRPQFFPVVFLSGFALVQLTELLWFALNEIHAPPCGVFNLCNKDAAQRALFLPSAIGYGIVFRRWSKELASIPEQVGKFRIMDALVKDERDREAVQENIVAFMIHYDKVPADAPVREVYEKFEDLVHREVPKLFRMSLGRISFPYHLIVTMGIPAIGRAIDIAALLIADGKKPSLGGYVVLHTCAYVFLLLPLVVYLVVKLVNCTHEWRLYSFVIAETIGGIFLLVSVGVAMHILSFLEDYSDAVHVLLFFGLFAVILFTGYVYRPPSSRRFKRTHNPLENCGLPSRKLNYFPTIKSSMSSISMLFSDRRTDPPTLVSAHLSRSAELRCNGEGRPERFEEDMMPETVLQEESHMLQQVQQQQNQPPHVQQQQLQQLQLQQQGMRREAQPEPLAQHEDCDEWPVVEFPRGVTFYSM